MTNGETLENAVLFHAECRRVREHAEMILAEARMLREQLDQTGGLLSLAVQAHAARTELVSLVAADTSHLQPSLAAA